MMVGLPAGTVPCTIPDNPDCSFISVLSALEHYTIPSGDLTCFKAMFQYKLIGFGLSAVVT